MVGLVEVYDICGREREHAIGNVNRYLRTCSLVNIIFVWNFARCTSYLVLLRPFFNFLQI